MAVLKLPDRTVDLDQRMVSGAHDHRLTELEVRVLGHLVELSDRPVSRDELLVEVWEYQPGVRSRAPDTLMKGLPGDLERVATALSTASPSEVLDELRTDPEGFWRAMPGDPGRSLPHLWSGLAPPARRLLQDAATWPAPVRRDHAVAAAGARPVTGRTLERAGALAVWRDASGHSRVAVPGRVR